MLSMSRSSIALATLVAISLLGTAAHADLSITIQEDAGLTQTFTVVGSPTGNLLLGPGLGGMPGTGIITTTDYEIDVQGGHANQAGLVSELLASAVTVLNTTGESGHILNISITGTGFTAPTAPDIAASSQIGGTTLISVTAGNSLSFLSIVSGAVPPTFVTPLSPDITTLGAV